MHSSSRSMFPAGAFSGVLLGGRFRVREWERVQALSPNSSWSLRTTTKRSPGIQELGTYSQITGRIAGIRDV